MSSCGMGNALLKFCIQKLPSCSFFLRISTIDHLIHACRVPRMPAILRKLVHNVATRRWRVILIWPRRTRSSRRAAAETIMLAIVCFDLWIMMRTVRACFMVARAIIHRLFTQRSFCCSHSISDAVAVMLLLPERVTYGVLFKFRWSPGAAGFKSKRGEKVSNAICFALVFSQLRSSRRFSTVFDLLLLLLLLNTKTDLKRCYALELSCLIAQIYFSRARQLKQTKGDKSVTVHWQ